MSETRDFVADLKAAEDEAVEILREALVREDPRLMEVLELLRCGHQSGLANASGST